MGMTWLGSPAKLLKYFLHSDEDPDSNWVISVLRFLAASATPNQWSERVIVRPH
jgi:hypothetical protein